MDDWGLRVHALERASREESTLILTKDLHRHTCVYRAQVYIQHTPLWQTGMQFNNLFQWRTKEKTDLEGTWGVRGKRDLLMSSFVLGELMLESHVEVSRWARWPQEVFSNPDNSMIFPLERTVLKRIFNTANRAEECWDQKVWGTRVHSITPVAPRQIQQEKRLFQFSAQNNCLGLLMKDGWRVPAQSISAVDKWHQHIICQGVFHQRQSRNKNVETSLDTSIFHLLKFWTP